MHYFRNSVQLRCISFDEFDEEINESYFIMVSLTKDSVFPPHTMLVSKN